MMVEVYKYRCTECNGKKYPCKLKIYTETDQDGDQNHPDICIYRNAIIKAKWELVE